MFSQVEHVLGSMIVTLHVMRPTAPDFHILFQGKHASQQPFQIPSVFSSQTRLGLNALVHFTCDAVATMADKVSFNHLNRARVYVCSGRAGGNERRLLFYARYEET